LNIITCFQYLASIWKQVPVSSCKSNPFEHSQPHSARTHVHLFALLLITGRAASNLNTPPQLSIKSSASSLIPRPMRGSAYFSTVGPTRFVNASASLIAVGTYSTLTTPHLTSSRMKCTRTSICFARFNRMRSAVALPIHERHIDCPTQVPQNTLGTAVAVCSWGLAETR
jgi:hypothetical protein